MITKTYNELAEMDTFEDRKAYLYIGDQVAHTTFGSARWMNQRLYSSAAWKRTRDQVILRDNGCDLGIEGCELGKYDILVHHINPITEEDIINSNPSIFSLDNLICCSKDTHNYIHFGKETRELSFERSANDTSPWRR